jgi:hypothetical protein
MRSYNRDDGEIDDIEGLDGSDIDVDDVELDELLESEAGGIDADLYRQLQGLYHQGLGKFEFEFLALQPLLPVPKL